MTKKVEGGRKMPPPFHGPQETIYYHHHQGFPIVSRPPYCSIQLWNKTRTALVSQHNLKNAQFGRALEPFFSILAFLAMHNVKIITTSMTFGKNHRAKQKVTQNRQNCFLTQNYCDLFFVEWICVIRCVSSPHTPLAGAHFYVSFPSPLSRNIVFQSVLYRKPLKVEASSDFL